MVAHQLAFEIICPTGVLGSNDHYPFKIGMRDGNSGGRIDMDQIVLEVKTRTAGIAVPESCKQFHLVAMELAVAYGG
ncbi:hypothetical protein GCM10017711_04220 [Paeniglutamicibacter sulfureus]